MSYPGAPPGVDTGGGGDSSASDSSGYGGFGYGGFGTEGDSSAYGGYGSFGGSYGGGPPPWAEFAAPTVTEAEKGAAWFRLVVAGIMLTLGPWAMLSFYRARYVLDIRTRSAGLVALAGISIIITFVVTVNESARLLWEESVDWFWSSLLLFFVTPVYTGSYIARATRLAVVFHPKARRRLPWLIPERNYIISLLFAGVCFLSIPIYHEETLQIWEIIPKQLDLLENISIGFAVVLASLYPFIRKVDDMFNISKELTAVMVLQLAVAVSGKLAREFGGAEAQKWIATNAQFVAAVCVFCISVIEPMRKLMFDPLAATKRNYASRVLLSRRNRGGQVTESEGQAHTANTSAGTAPGPDLEEEAPNGGVWDFERLASTPMLAAAFEQFARKALCQESVQFLAEVSRYVDGDYSTVQATMPERTADQFDYFNFITKTYICNGAPDEVNISSSDKQRILDCYHGGLTAFLALPTWEERRLIFGQAYVEVRGMLEDNLLQRFMLSPEFKQVRAQRETMTAMADSPNWAVPA